MEDGECRIDMNMLGERATVNILVKEMETWNIQIRYSTVLTPTDRPTNQPLIFAL